MIRHLVVSLCWLFFSIAPALAYPPIRPVENDAQINTLLMETGSLPLFTCQLTLLHAGHAYAPEGKAGLVSLYGEMLSEGAGAYDGAAFQQAMDLHAIHLNVAPSVDHLTLRVRAPSSQAERAFDLLKAMIHAPHFKAEQLEREKEQLRIARLARAQSAAYVAYRHFLESIYPASHPYRQPSLGTEESTRDITPEQLRQFHTSHWSRHNIRLACVGDITAEFLARQVETIAKPLPETSDIPLIEPITPKMQEPLHIAFDTPQSQVIFGAPSLARDHPDYYAQYLLNYLLGGGSFASRLMQVVREENGLVYGIGTYLDNAEASNMWMGNFATSNDTTDKAIALTEQVLASMQAGEISEQERADALNAIIGSLPVKADSTHKLVQYVQSIQLYDLGLDYLEKREAYFRAVTLEDMKRVAKEWLNPSRFTFAIASPDKE